MQKRIRICYIGGGSKQWARVFMNDLALAGDLTGTIALYDIDRPAAERNRRIGERLNAHPDALSHWDYAVADTLKEALDGADFVVISILPGTFSEMQADVHLPERVGVWQTVGDTAGPGGVLRAMRTVPLFEEIARAIEAHCPGAWVLNLTNPMTVCVRTLYGTFPGIRAFGCCHEVFHAQDFLCFVLQEMLGVPRPGRRELFTDVAGVNHFTWITEAHWRDTDVLRLLPGFMERCFEQGICTAPGAAPDAYKTDVFACGNRVKMDLFRRFGALGAAGDRHLVEFLDGGWYLRSPADAERWAFRLTNVDFRIRQQAERVAESEALASGALPVVPKRSDEELIDLIRAILGLGTRVSNVNTANRGQIASLPLGSVVETNCVFTDDTVQPLVAKPLPPAADALVQRASRNAELTYAGAAARDLGLLFEAFVQQPLMARVPLSDAHSLFTDMVRATRPYLAPYYPGV